MIDHIQARCYAHHSSYSLYVHNVFCKVDIGQEFARMIINLWSAQFSHGNADASIDTVSSSMGAVVSKGHPLVAHLGYEVKNSAPWKLNVESA